MLYNNGIHQFRGGQAMLHQNKSRLITLTTTAAAFVLIIILAAVSASAGGARAEVVEAPHVRIVVDGVPGIYTDVPLEINKRILLPFREVLAKLGVPNDSEHIIWNDDEESVTVYFGDDTIKLTVGSNVMTLNGKKLEFDVSPYYYHKNDRTYVPVRAISELLGKVIMWEESTTTVYIRNKANYEETLDLLKRIRGAKEVTKIKAESNGKVKINIKTDNGPFSGADADGALNATMDMSQLVMADLEKGIYHIKQVTGIEGTSIGTELFMYKDRMFTKVEGSGANWTEVTGQGAYDSNSMLEQMNVIENQMSQRELSDVAMSLAVSVSQDGSYMLVGEPITISEVNSILDVISAILPKEDSADYSMKFNSFLIATIFNDKLNPVNSGVSSNVDFSMKEKTENGRYVTVFINMDMNYSINYEQVDSNYTVPVPEGVAALI